VPWCLGGSVCGENKYFYPVILSNFLVPAPPGANSVLDAKKGPAVNWRAFLSQGRAFHCIFLVEAVGIEPTSEDTPEVTATCLVGFQSLAWRALRPTSIPPSPAGNYLAVRVPAPRTASPFYRRPAQFHGRGPYTGRGCLYLGGQSQVIVGNYWFFPFFYEAWVLGMLSDPVSIPVETVSPPLFLAKRMG